MRAEESRTTVVSRHDDDDALRRGIAPGLRSPNVFGFWGSRRRTMVSATASANIPTHVSPRAHCLSQLFVVGLTVPVLDRQEAEPGTSRMDAAGRAETQ